MMSTRGLAVRTGRIPPEVGQQSEQGRCRGAYREDGLHRPTGACQGRGEEGPKRRELPLGHVHRPGDGVNDYETQSQQGVDGPVNDPRGDELGELLTEAHDDGSTNWPVKSSTKLPSWNQLSGAACPQSVWRRGSCRCQRTGSNSGSTVR
jgi:hypothetical protein